MFSDLHGISDRKTKFTNWKEGTLGSSWGFIGKKALLWISEKYFEFNGKEISADELDEIQSRGELDVGQFYLCLDKDIDAKS